MEVKVKRRGQTSELPVRHHDQMEPNKVVLVLDPHEAEHWTVMLYDYICIHKEKNVMELHKPSNFIYITNFLFPYYFYKLIALQI